MCDVCAVPSDIQYWKLLFSLLTNIFILKYIYFFSPTAVHSHICKVAGNYLNDHTTNAKPFGGPDTKMTCDTIINQVLGQNDFSSAFDCSQVADDLKNNKN